MKILIDLELDGYLTKEERDKAALVFIEEQLNFSASYMTIIWREDMESPKSGVYFSKSELEALKDLLNEETRINWQPYDKEQAKQAGAQKYYGMSLKEIKEFANKIGRKI